jgi:hypothetical protein
MTKDMRIIVSDGAGTTILPLYSTLDEQIDPIQSENITLDGAMFTDFTSNRRAWRVGWEKLKAADYDIVRAIYNRQYSTESIPIIVLPEYGISAPMKMVISDRNIALNGEIIKGFSVVLKEQYAVS